MPRADDIDPRSAYPEQEGWKADSKWIEQAAGLPETGRNTRKVQIRFGNWHSLWIHAALCRSISEDFLKGTKRWLFQRKPDRLVMSSESI
jgi:hypothetical protein